MCLVDRDQWRSTPQTVLEWHARLPDVRTGQAVEPAQLVEDVAGQCREGSRSMGDLEGVDGRQPQPQAWPARCPSGTGGWGHPAAARPRGSRAAWPPGSPAVLPGPLGADVVAGGDSIAPKASHWPTTTPRTKISQRRMDVRLSQTSYLSSRAESCDRSQALGSRRNRARAFISRPDSRRQRRFGATPAEAEPAYLTVVPAVRGCGTPRT